MTAYSIGLSLRGVPGITRKVTVPGDVTFEELSGVINSVYGWDDGHRHSFSAGSTSIVGIDPFEGLPEGAVDERELPLSAYDRRELSYMWARWNVDMDVGIIDVDCDRPAVTEFSGESPPSVLTSAVQYRRALQAMRGDGPDRDGARRVFDESRPDGMSELNAKFERWERAGPLGEELTAEQMASLLEAYADYGREYSFDTVGLVPVPSEGHTGNRYIPIVHGKDFPSAVAHENLPGYERRGRNVAASVDRALEAASDEDRERFAIALKSEAAMLAEEWAFRHRYRYDPVAGSVPTGSGTELSDGDIADVVGALEAEFRRRNFPASAASAEQDCADERNLKATGFPCPVCGADCTAVPDRKGRRSDIGGVLRRPAILKCGSCGAERELRLMNDGYAVGYFVKDFPHPLAETRPLIELRNRAESETDTARRRGLLCELALELYRNDMLDEARERAREAAMTLPSEPGEGFDDHVRTLAVLMLCSNGSMGKLSKRVAAIRNTRSKDLTGRYGALFASLCAVTAKNPSETARFCEIASGLLDGMPMDFVALVARKNVVTAMSVKNAKDRHPGVLEAMDIAEDWAEHIGDGPSSADAKQLAMIFEAAVTIAAVNGMRAEARGFVNGFGDRHTMKGTGLHPIVTFRRALVDYTDGRTDDAIAGFTEVLDLYDTGEDRGGPAMARAAMAATILGHEVDSSLYARGMLMASALLRGGSVDREGMTEFLRVWCPLAAREMHWSERVMTLKHAGMEYLEGHMEDFAKERADANAVWNSSRFLICRGKRFIPL